MKGVKSMKKQYVKPELYFENFELSTSIASCSPGYNVSHAMGDCAHTIGGEKVFMNNPPCQTIPQEDGEICYQNSQDGSRYFSS